MSETLEAPVRPAFANFVGGEWLPSESGKTYEKRSPWRPAETIGEFPASGEADVNAAVEAAAAAFPEWSRRPGAQRAAILNAAADAIERRVEQIAQDMTLEMGKPLREARMEAARMAAILRFFAGEAWRPKGELFEQSATGGAVYTIRRPLGVVGLITPWNFPAAIPAWKSAPALDLRQHRRDEARAGGAAHRPPSRGVLRRGRHARRRLQHRRRPRRRGGHATREPSAGARDLVHRLGRGRRAGARRGDRARQARPARARRPEPADRDGRRRPRPRGRGRLRRRLLVGRPEVHGHPAHLRPGRVYDEFRSAAARADRPRASSATRPTRPPRSARS